MSRITKLCLTTLIGFTTLPAMNFAHAADQGQYRPGNPYQSLPLQSAALCETQCQSDRDCRGWNFVKINPRQDTGVCEFNAQSAAPVRSPMSVSGTGSVSQASSRLVSTGTRTVRVGSPEPQNNHLAQNRLQHQLQGRTEVLAPRRVVRAPLPNRTPPTVTSYNTNRGFANESLTAQRARQRQAHTGAPNLYKTRPAQMAPTPSNPYQPRPTAPRLSHNLDGMQTVPVSTQNQRQFPQGQAVNRQMLQGQMPQGQIPVGARPKLQYALDGRNIQSRAMMRQAPQPGVQSPYSPQNVQRQAQSSSQAQTRPYPQASTYQTAPDTRSVNPQKSAPQIQINRPVAPMPYPQNLEAAQSSLFGSLYDDVKQPKSLSLSDISDPNAPISTVQSVPVNPDRSDPLSQLAGQ